MRLEVSANSANSYLFKVNDVVLVFLLLTYFTPFSSVSIVDFEQGKVSWERKVNFKNNFGIFFVS